MTPEIQRDFAIEIRGLVQLLRAETGRLHADARRLEARGNPLFAAEVLALRDRLSVLCRTAEQLVPPGRAP